MRKHCRLLALKDFIVIMLKKEKAVLEDKYLALFYARDLYIARGSKVNNLV